MWWDTDRIERTVTPQFVHSQLLPEEIARLNRPLSFGDGLTDGTYLDWIIEKGKKIFCILVDLGVPDQIFGVIDDSWDDGDLPIALDHVERLALTPARDEKAERKFYYRQFHYLLRPLEKGEHVVYQEMEVVPVDIVEKRPGLATQHHSIDRVKVPSEPGKVLCRRRIPLGSGPGCLAHEDFQYEINSIRNVQNDHLVSYWGSYVHQGYGYVLFTPASDLNFKSFLATTPSSVKNLDKKQRKPLVMNWIHCLVDTLCFVHNRGLSHGNIKPSTILFNAENHIFFSDFTRLNAELLATATDRTPFDKESYDYAAPEQWFRPSAFTAGPLGRKVTLTALSTSPDNTTFSISRGGYDHTSPLAMMNSPNPQLNPQAADVFSLGCIILELLGFIVKRTSRSFASHRSAKHKTPGRGGAVLDSSFHKNLGQVESWMASLAKEAAKKKDDPICKGIVPMLHVVERMLAFQPSERPSASDLQTRMYQILTEVCGQAEPHCVHQYGGWDYNVGGLKMASPTSPTFAGGEDVFFVGPKRNSGGGYNVRHARHDSGGSRVPRDYLVERRDFATEYQGGSVRNSQVREKVRSPWQAQFTGIAV